MKQRQLAEKKQSDECKKEEELCKKEEDEQQRAMAAKEATVISPSNPPQMGAEKENAIFTLTFLSILNRDADEVEERSPIKNKSKK